MALRRLARRVVWLRFKRGEMICRRGDPAEFLYFLAAGRVRAFVPGEDAARRDVSFIRRGSPFGYPALLTDTPQERTFEALSDCEVAAIHRRDLEGVMKIVPRLGLDLGRLVSRRMEGRDGGGTEAATGRIIGICGLADGEKASFYALVLARRIREIQGKKVLLVHVEAEGRRSSGGTIGLRWQGEGVRFSDRTDPMDPLRRGSFRGVLPMDVLLLRLDGEDPPAEERIGEFLAHAAAEYAYVLLDLPAEPEGPSRAFLAQADRVHLLIEDAPAALRRGRMMIDALEERLKGRFDPAVVAFYLLDDRICCRLSVDTIQHALDYPLAGILPPPVPGGDAGRMATPFLQAPRPLPGRPFEDRVLRIAREVTGSRVGLVLGGGAAFGLAHIGVLRVLEREGIPIDIVAGSSMGALIAALWVTGRDADAIEEAAREFDDQRALLKLFDPILPVSGFIGGRLIRRWLLRYLGEMSFCNTRIPLKVVAYDLFHRRDLIIESGPLVEAVRRSVAIPGVIKPVIDAEQVIIDGGVVNPLPTDVLSSAGVGAMIAVNVLPSPEDVMRGHGLRSAAGETPKPRGLFSGALHGRFSRVRTPTIPDIIVSSMQATEYVLASQNARRADVVVHPDVAGIEWYELYRLTELVRRGEEAASRVLPALRSLARV